MPSAASRGDGVQVSAASGGDGVRVLTASGVLAPLATAAASAASADPDPAHYNLRKYSKVQYSKSIIIYSIATHQIFASSSSPFSGISCRVGDLAAISSTTYRGIFLRLGMHAVCG